MTQDTATGSVSNDVAGSINPPIDKLKRLNNDIGVVEVRHRVVVRPASEGDLDWIVEELKEFDRFYGSKRALFGDEVYVRKALEKIMWNHVFLVAEKNGERLGFIAGIRHPHFYNPNIRVLTELFWWVVPSRRGAPTMGASRAGKMLLDRFTEIGRASADWITLSISKFTPVKKRSFIKQGFLVSDQSYLMEVA